MRGFFIYLQARATSSRERGDIKIDLNKLLLNILLVK